MDRIKSSSCGLAVLVPLAMTAVDCTISVDSAESSSPGSGGALGGTPGSGGNMRLQESSTAARGGAGTVTVETAPVGKQAPMGRSERCRRPERREKCRSDGAASDADAPSGAGGAEGSGGLSGIHGALEDASSSGGASGSATSVGSTTIPSDDDSGTGGVEDASSNGGVDADAPDDEGGMDGSTPADSGDSASPVCLVRGREYTVQFEGRFHEEHVTDQCMTDPLNVIPTIDSHTLPARIYYDGARIHFAMNLGSIHFRDTLPFAATPTGFRVSCSNRGGGGGDGIFAPCACIPGRSGGAYDLDFDCAAAVVTIRGACEGGSHTWCATHIHSVGGSFDGIAALWPCTPDQPLCPGVTPECRNGVCECTPSTTPVTCNANSTPQFCNADRQWQDRAEGPCSGSTPVCAYGICGVCAPDSTPPRCVADNTPQFCNGSNQWERAARPCSGSTPICLDGACRPCVPNPTPTACSADHTPQFCNANGQWQDRAEGPCFVCSMGRCVASTGSGPRITQISGGCALFDDGRIKCWGANGAGQLGLGDTANRGDGPDEMGPNLPWIALGSAQKAIWVSAAGSRTCAALANGQFKCWGNNAWYQLGLGDDNNRGDNANEMGDALPSIDVGTNLPATAVFAGAHGTCAFFDNSELKCWAAAVVVWSFGLPVWRPHPLDSHGNLPTMDFGIGRTVTTISLGNWHHCVLLNHGHVTCWGTNASGQLGFGNTDGIGEWRFENPSGASLPEVNLGAGRTASAIAVGGMSSCALLDDGQVKCWGANSAGQLGLGDTANRGDEPGEMGDNLPAVDLGTGRTAKTIAMSGIVNDMRVPAGGEHACAILDNGQVKCWGDNAVGQLGLGDTANRGDEPGEMGDSLPAVDLGTGRTAIAISVEPDFACAILDNGQVKCWGGNAAGQLGLGDTANRGDEPGEMGDNLPVVQLW